ncbi:hypothetical protein CISIN_1g043781mg, partial [Citrus sinensis]
SRSFFQDFGKQVKKLTSNLRAIQAVLNDAEQRQVKEASVRLWLDQLKEASYDMEDVLDEWITARLKLQIEGVDENALVRKKPKIIEINENLDDIAKQKEVFNFNVIRGSTEKSERIHSTALINVSDVRGMGGIGKTTLAQFAYNDKDVIENFDKRIWVCVSDPFDEFRIAKAIIEGLEGSEKKFFLILDDVWTDDYSKWEPFHNCLMRVLQEFAAIEVDGDENPLSLTSTCQEKLRHLTLTLGLRAKFPVSIFDAKKIWGWEVFGRNTSTRPGMVSRYLMAEFCEPVCSVKAWCAGE